MISFNYMNDIVHTFVRIESYTLKYLREAKKDGIRCAKKANQI